VALVDRVKNILLTPNTEWPIIAGEPTTVGALYTGYIIPLAIIPAVAGFIGRLILFHSLVSGLIFGVLGFVLGLIMIYVEGLIAAALAPSFGGQKDQMAGLKWAAYSQTAAFVAGIANIIPIAGGFIALIGALYGLYLFYLGTVPMMKVPQDKAIGYAVVVILVNIVLSFIIGAVVAAVAVGSAISSGGFPHSSY